MKLGCSCWLALPVSSRFCGVLSHLHLVMCFVLPFESLFTNDCAHADNNLGPSSGTALGDAGSSFDYVRDPGVTMRQSCGVAKLSCYIACGSIASMALCCHLSKCTFCLACCRLPAILRRLHSQFDTMSLTATACD